VVTIPGVVDTPMPELIHTSTAQDGNLCQRQQ
jgi:hypothetical protein